LQSTDSQSKRAKQADKKTPKPQMLKRNRFNIWGFNIFAALLAFWATKVIFDYSLPPFLAHLRQKTVTH
jgi:hypothetical protein